MYSAALSAIIFIGNLKVILIALGVTAGFFSVVVWIMRGMFEEYDTHVKKAVLSVLCVCLPFIWISCIAVYNLPSMRQEIVIAKQVAPVLDDYMERHPDSVYNPDIMLTALDDTVKGIVGSAVELPKYIQKLAAGGIPALIEKKPEDMSRDELLRKIQELEKK